MFASAAQEAGWIADQLRRAHLSTGCPWSQMAVLSRSARRTLPALRRALLAAGVPIAAPPDELPLARQPAVVPLLMVLRYAARPDELDADAATALLTSPLGSADPMRMRRLRRGLLRLHAAGREARENAAADAHPVPRPRCRRRAVDDSRGRRAHRERPAAGRGPARGRARAAGPARRACPPHETAPLRRVGALLAIAGDAARDGRERRGGALAGLAGQRARPALERRQRPRRARRRRRRPRSRRRARAVRRRRPHADRLPGADVAAFIEYLADQQLPGRHAGRQAPRGATPSRCSPRTPPAAGSGTSSPCPGVQEGAWPDLRLRGSLLGNERLVDLVAGVAEPAGAGVPRVAPLLAEERRLFYVACTRARHTLLVSAVPRARTSSRRASSTSSIPLPAGQADRPGRTGPAAPWCSPSWSASCAGPCAHPTEPGEPQPRSAARRPAPRSSWPGWPRPASPAPHPDDWYGARAGVHATRRCARPARSCPVSPSDVEKIIRCPLRWVLERHGGGDVGRARRGHRFAGARTGPGRGGGGGRRASWRARCARRGRGSTRARPWFGRRELARVRGDARRRSTAGCAASRAEGLRLVAVEQPVQLDLADPDDVDVAAPGPGCGCAAGSTGWRSTRPGARSSST